MNTLREAIRQILITDRSNREIGITVGLSHTSIGKYRKRLTHCDLDWTAINALDDKAVEKLVRSTRRRTYKKRTPDWVYIYNEMQKPNMTLQLVWEEYCMAEPESAYSYSAFALKYRKYARKLDLSMRQHHRAGECVFVDFAGTTVPYVSADGEMLSAQIFVGVLGCSNYTFSCALKSQSLPDWVEAHNRMFLYFGGIPEVIVPDNLKSAITQAGRIPVVNRTYLEMSNYYGAVIVPTRVGRPKDKAKAEVGVLIVSRWILSRLRNRKFFSIEEINREITELLWQLNERPFKKLPGCRRSRFEELDKPLLKPHPGKPFEYEEWVSRQKVRPDYHVYVKDHYYSVPHELVGEHVEARVTNHVVEILNHGRRVASHPRSHVLGGHTTLPAHQPDSHRHFANLTPDKLRSWAGHIGPASLAAVEYQFTNRPHALLGIKACTSLQRLAKEYGVDKFEAACRRAEMIGSLSVKSIRSILQRRLTEQPEGQFPIQINLPLHHNVRGADYYAK